MQQCERVVLTWPTNFTGFTLQSTTNLVSPAIWTTVPPAPVVDNSQNPLTNPISGPRQFYRLAPLAGMVADVTESHTNTAAPDFMPTKAPRDRERG